MRKLASLSIVMVAMLANVSMAQSKLVPVLSGLVNPCGVTIQPGTGDVFVAESGAGRIIRVVNGKAEDVIVDFPSDTYGKGPFFAIGPLGLLFLDKDTLVVGGGGYKDGEELLRVYKIPSKGAAAIKADKMVGSFKLAGSDDQKGEGNFYALASDGKSIFVTCNGDDTKGWVARATLTGTKVGSFERFLATKEATELDAPVAITMDPKGGHLVVGQMGEIKNPKDGMVTFYNAKSKKKLANFEVPLSDITGLAYSPKGQLYATDFAHPAGGKDQVGGLYQLIADRSTGKQTVKVNKIATLVRPTAIAFGKDGACYITTCGKSEDGSDNKKTGQLLMIAKGL